MRKLRVAAETCRPQDLRRCAGIENDAWVMGAFCTVHMPALWEDWARANMADTRADAHARVCRKLRLIEMELERPELADAYQLNSLGRTAAEQRKLDIAMSVAEKYDEERKATELNARLEAEHRAEQLQTYRKAELATGPVRVAPAIEARADNGGWFHIWCTAERVDARGVKTLRECAAGIHPVLGELRLPAAKLGPEWAPLLRRAADIMEKRTVES
ncbi:MAG: hypothetical protein IPK85_01315 [Gemmatimonadetes bacterium]|nr:hypothetical protein [Gemmatimonadota bacterium]